MFASKAGAVRGSVATHEHVSCILTGAGQHGPPCSLQSLQSGVVEAKNVAEKKKNVHDLDIS